MPEWERLFRQMVGLLHNRPYLALLKGLAERDSAISFKAVLIVDQSTGAIVQANPIAYASWKGFRLSDAETVMHYYEVVTGTNRPGSEDVTPFTEWMTTTSRKLCFQELLRVISDIEERRAKCRKPEDVLQA